jgi:hypothetical protein
MFQLDAPSIVTRNKLTIGDYSRSDLVVGVGVGVGVGMDVGVDLASRICTDAMQSEVVELVGGRCFCCFCCSVRVLAVAAPVPGVRCFSDARGGETRGAPANSNDP